MSLGDWTILLFVVGAVLLIAELALPTHGILGVLGGGGILGGVVLSFILNRWLGLGLLAAILALAPLAGAWFAWIWPRTFVGRRLVLQPVQIQTDPLAVQIGQTGTTLSELRPIGICEFGEKRVEALSAYGLIEPGRQVKVIGMDNRRPIVAAV